MWIVYILQCKNSYTYTGVTNDLLKRIQLHNSGKGAKFTNSRKPCYHIWHEHHLNNSSAQKREQKIKSWNKKKKLEFVNKNQNKCSKCNM